MRWLVGLRRAVGALLTLGPAALGAQGRAWVAGPIALESARLDALSTATLWVAHAGKQVTIYAQPGSYAEAHAQEFLRRADRAAADNLRLLGLRDYPHRRESNASRAGHICSLRAQSAHEVEPRHAPRGQPARQQRNGNHGHRGAGEDPEIDHGHLIKQAAQ